MGILKRKGETFDLVFLIEKLEPWPTQHGPLAITWQRGSKRGGSTRTALPESDAPRGSTAYIFEDSIHVPCTLYPKQLEDGTMVYQPKLLTLNVSQVSDKGKTLSTLGSATVDLSEVAFHQSPVHKSLSVDCTSAIRLPSGGSPLLFLSMGNVSERAPSVSASLPDRAATATNSGADSTSVQQEISLGAELQSRVSLDSDTNQPSSSRRSGSRGDRIPLPEIPPEEQYDEDGFLVDLELPEFSETVQLSGLTGAPTELSEPGSIKRNLTYSGAEGEMPRDSGGDADTIGPAPSTNGSRPGSSKKFTNEGGKGRRWAWLRPSGDASPSGSNSPASPFGADPKAQKAAAALNGNIAGASPRESSRLGSRLTFKLGKGGHDLDSPNSRGGNTPLRGRSTTLSEGDVAMLDSAAMELKMLAALESSVYFAGSMLPNKTASPASLDLQQAPARRLARTIIMLGPSSGVTFGMKAVEAIKGAALASMGDTQKLVTWWSNVLTLRWSFWALNQTSVNTPIANAASAAAAVAPSSGGSQLAWATDSLLPAFRDLEAWLFDNIVDICWRSVMLHKATESALAADEGRASGSPRKRSSSGNNLGLDANGAGVDRSNSTSRSIRAPNMEDPATEAVHHWTIALEAVEESLMDPRRPQAAPKSHILLLRSQVMLCLLGRLDDVLFANLVSDPVTLVGPRSVRKTSSGGSGLTSPTALNPINTSSGSANSLLHARLLPFARGPLTFTAAVAMKMAVGRLTDWANDAGIKLPKTETSSLAAMANQADNDSSSATSSGPALLLLPKLRSAADVLMMPKSGLLSADLRKELAPGLSAHAVCQVLERYRPDDVAPDSIPVGLVQKLKSEAAKLGGDDYAVVISVERYQPPADVLLLAQGLVQPLNLGMSDESDDELSALESQWNEGTKGTNRYKLLRELWQGARLV